jgi:hypothetical protein
MSGNSAEKQQDTLVTMEDPSQLQVIAWHKVQTVSFNRRKVNMVKLRGSKGRTCNCNSWVGDFCSLTCELAMNWQGSWCQRLGSACGLESNHMHRSERTAEYLAACLQLLATCGLNNQGNNNRR